MNRDAHGGPVLVIGDVMTDIICRSQGGLVIGSDRTAKISSRAGGSGANQAVWLAAFGVDAHLAARVGAVDKPRLEASFRARGVTPHLCGDPDLGSGTLITILSPDGERSFLTDRGANLALSSTDLAPALLAGVARLVISGYVYFSEGPRAAVRGFCARAATAGVPIYIDPASAGFLREVGAANFLRWSAGAHTIFANEAEAEVLTGSAVLATQMARLGDHFPRVVIKCGSAGAVMGSRDGIGFSLPAPVIEAVDTTGAGDAFAAGFIAAELGGGDDRVCLGAGIEAGVRAAQKIGGQPD